MNHHSNPERTRRTHQRLLPISEVRRLQALLQERGSANDLGMAVCKSVIEQQDTLIATSQHRSI